MHLVVNLFHSGADIQVAIDGHFNHRHLWLASECPSFYIPQYVISKEQVDTIGYHIDKLCKRPPKVWQPVIPDDAVDECESSYTAGSGSSSKMNMEKFDNGSQMAPICHHNIPLFFANIDMPGEQQKCTITLIEHLYSLLPPKANAQVLYDAVCVLDWTLQLVGP